MKNLFALIGFACVAMLLAGAFLGWYRFDPKPSESGTKRIEVTMEPAKVSTDMQTFFARLMELIQAIREQGK